MVVTGDLAQADRLKDNGLLDFIGHLKDFEAKRIDVCEFAYKDIERHQAVKEVLRVYGDE
jgi:phosphate starvation-inducible protein PhoH